MAARVLLRHTAAPLLATSIVFTVPTIAFAEAPAPASSSPSSLQHNKKPIYDVIPPMIPSSSTTTTTQPAPATAPETALETVPTTPSRPRGPTPTDRLAGQIKLGRLWLHSRVVVAEDGVNGVLTRAFALERTFTETVASLGPARASGERLMPGAIYVLVAAMAGSVVSRNRGIILRAGAPVALGIVAAKAFVPITTRNVSDLVWEWEKKVPGVAEAHTTVTGGAEKAVHFAKVHANLGRTWVEDNVGAAREKVESWVKKGK